MRNAICKATTIVLLNLTAWAHAQAVSIVEPSAKLVSLEKSFAGKIGVYALNTHNNQIIAYRADERFPMQSTLKMMVAAKLFKQSQTDATLLQQTIRYSQRDLTFWHPITGRHVDQGMTLAALSEAAVSYSDNPAANLLIKKLGGPAAMTDFAHSMGNASFQIEHYEGQLNSNPESQSDTVTPKDMALSVQALTLGDVLTPAQRTQLVTWMKNNTVGYKRMRAGVPMGWTVADKTGTGSYGVANDMGIVWSPTCQPIVLAIYTVRHAPDAKTRDDIVAATTQLVMDEFAKTDSCFKQLSA